MSLGTDAVATLHQNVAAELIRLQNAPGAHPWILALGMPVYDCRVEYTGDQDVELHWSVEADGFDRNVTLLTHKETIRREGVRFPRCWLDPIESLQVFDLLLKLSLSAPVRYNLDDRYKCVYLGTVSSMTRDECVFNPFLWEEERMSNLCVLVSWANRIDGGRVHTRHYAEGIKNFKPPDCVLADGRDDEDESSESTPEIENSQEREMMDYFLQAVDELEPLVDVTQM